MDTIVKEGTKSGTIIFIHGNSSSPVIYEDILNDDSIAYTKIAPVLPGHQNTGLNHVSAIITHYIEELIHLCSSIEEDIFLVGNSLGGHLAVEVAAKVDNIKGIMLIGAAPLDKPYNFESCFHQLDEFQVFFNTSVADLELRNALGITVVDQKHLEVLCKDFKQTLPQTRQSFLEAVVHEEWSNQKEIFDNLIIRKFVVNGSKDPLIKLDYQQTLEINISEGDEFVLVEDCGHFLPLEKPNLFAELITRTAQKVFKS